MMHTERVILFGSQPKQGSNECHIDHARIVLGPELERCEGFVHLLQDFRQIRILHERLRRDDDAYSRTDIPHCIHHVHDKHCITNIIPSSNLKARSNSQPGICNDALF